MAKAAKTARNITVGAVRFRWRATGNDGWISLTIWPRELPGPVIACSLDYHHTPEPLANGVLALTRQVIVTNRLVRGVIELAISQFGYDAAKKGKQLNLPRVDELLDMSKALRAE